MLYADANVLLRFILRDNVEMAQVAEEAIVDMRKQCAQHRSACVRLLATSVYSARAIASS